MANRAFFRSSLAKMWLQTDGQVHYLRLWILGTLAYLHILASGIVAYCKVHNASEHVYEALPFICIPALVLSVEVHLYALATSIGGLWAWITTQHMMMGRIIFHNLNVLLLSGFLITWFALLCALPVPLRNGNSLLACCIPLLLLLIVLLVQKVLVKDGFLGLNSVIMVIGSIVSVVLLALKADHLISVSWIEASTSLFVTLFLGSSIISYTCIQEMKHESVNPYPLGAWLFVFLIWICGCAIVLFWTVAYLDGGEVFTNRLWIGWGCMTAAGYFIFAPALGVLLYNMTAAHWAGAANENVPLMLGMANSHETLPTSTN